MTNPQTTLKPCPFTGEKPQFRLAKKRRCQLHGDPLPQDTIIFSSAASFQARTKEEAIEAWNTRADISPQAVDVEALKRECIDDFTNDQCRWLGHHSIIESVIDHLNERGLITLDDTKGNDNV
jgi:hypothetical protein